MDAVRELCDRAIWLDGGGVCADGDPERVVERYLHGTPDEACDLDEGRRRLSRGQRWGSGEIELTDVRFVAQDGEERSWFVTGEPFQVRMRYQAHRRVKSPVFGMAFHSSEGARLNGSTTYTSGYDIDWVEGEGEVTYRLDSLPLLEGTYLFTAAAYDFGGRVHQAYDHLDKAFLIQVRPGKQITETLGMVYMPCHWDHMKLS
jgi:hypothetical protein